MVCGACAQCFCCVLVGVGMPHPSICRTLLFKLHEKSSNAFQSSNCMAFCTGWALLEIENGMFLWYHSIDYVFYICNTPLTLFTCPIVAITYSQFSRFSYLSVSVLRWYEDMHISPMVAHCPYILYMSDYVRSSSTWFINGARERLIHILSTFMVNHTFTFHISPNYYFL